MTRDDLFTPRADEETKPAPCGFLPRGGWPHKWARDGHRDSCNDCAEIEAMNNTKEER